MKAFSMLSTRRSYVALLLSLFLWLPMTAFADDVSASVDLTPPSTDTSVVYLSQIFGNVDGVLTGSGSQILGHMFGKFNAAILVLASILLTYVIIVGTLNTANEGQMMGQKWSSMWLPIRTFMGVSLLVPKASGYCFIQIFVMWLVLQGVGAANSVWNAALDYLNSGGIIVQQSLPTDTGIATTQMGGIFQTLTCLYGMQKQLEVNASQGQQVPSLIDTVIPLGTSPVPVPNLSSMPTKNYPNVPTSLTGMCGKISWPSTGKDAALLPPQEAGDQATDMRAIALQQAMLSLAPAAARLASATCDPTATANTCGVNQICVSNGGAGGGGNLGWCMCPSNSVADPNAQNYCSPGSVAPTVLADAAQAYQGVMFAILNHMDSDNIAERAFITQAKTDGWILAGSYYVNLVALNNHAHSLHTDPGAQVDGPNVLALKGQFGDQGTSTSAYLLPLVSSNGPTQQFLKVAIEVAQTITYGNQSIKNGVPSWGANVTGAGSSGGFVASNMFNAITGSLGNVLNGLFTSQATNANPVLLVATLGRQMIDIGVTMWIVIMVVTMASTVPLALIPCAAVGTIIQTLVTVSSGVMTTVIGILVGSGTTLAYYVPLVPFLLFTFGGISWMIAVIEAMVAAPLVAFGLAHPDGHDAFGKAEQAILVILNVFLRPMLMIFGFITGIILSYVGVWLLNRGFGQAYLGLTSQFSAVEPAYWFLPLATAVIYTMTVIAIINSAFSLIYILPDKITRWLSGGQAESFGEGTAATSMREVQGGMDSAGKTAGQGSSQLAQSGTQLSGGIKQDTQERMARQDQKQQQSALDIMAKNSEKDKNP